MSETIEDLTVAYEEDGKETVKELDKMVLSKGAWSTVIYKYQDWDQRKEEYSQTKFTIRRYQKQYGAYKQKSKFNISSVAQAEKIVEVLTGWLKEEQE